MRAVVLAGGGGTRLRPLTLSTPKPMIEFMGRPYAVGLLLRLVDAGVDRMDLLVGTDSDAFVELVDAGRQLGVAVEVLTEERPLDTAGAARRLLRGSGERDVLVCNGDQLTDLDYADLVARHQAANASVTLAMARVDDTSSFGVIETDADGTVTAFIEKPAPGTTDTDTVNAGTYVLDAAAFDPFAGDGPLSFERDVFPGVLGAGMRVRGEAYEAHWQDLGTPQRYRDGCRAVLEGHCRWPVPDDLQIRDGAVAVHATAQVAADAKLVGPVVVGARAQIGRGAHLRDAVVLRDGDVGAGAQVTEAILGPGTRIAEGATVGPGEVLVADDA